MKTGQINAVIANNTSKDIRDELVKLGLNVTACKSIMETLPLFQQRIDIKPDLLIVSSRIPLGGDLSESQMTVAECDRLGIVFAKYIKAINPFLPVIVLADDTLSWEMIKGQKKNFRNFEAVYCNSTLIRKITLAIGKIVPKRLV